MFKLDEKLKPETFEELTKRCLLIGKAIDYMSYKMNVYMSPDVKVEIYEHLETLDYGTILHLYTTKSYKEYFTITDKVEDKNELEEE